MPRLSRSTFAISAAACFGERGSELRITGIAPGSYDVTVEDETGRKCLVRNIAVQAGAIFSIEERQLTECGE